MPAIKFSIEKKIPNKLGRAGVIETKHGNINTPAFVTVGTKGAFKAMTPEQLVETGAQVGLCNTYHLFLEPGDHAVAEQGGLHQMMNWPGPLMTDSGGFQVFSLGAAYGKDISKITKPTDAPMLLREAKREMLEDRDPILAKIDEEGVTFKSHLDGALHYITPSRSIEIQHNLGADMIFAFDECTSPNETYTYQREALDRTHRWARQSLKYHQAASAKRFGKPMQALFGIVQGGRFEDLRKESAEIIGKMEVNGGAFDGFGIGGSFAKEDMSTAVKWVNEILPDDKPRHLLGIGEPEDLFMAVEQGCDLFDCVAPTRIGRHGNLYTRRGKINILNREFRSDLGPIDSKCDCFTCRNYTRAYVAYLHRAKEILASTLCCIHNLYFIINLVKEMREHILSGTFLKFKEEFLAIYQRK